jgi:hypothetical protein
MKYKSCTLKLAACSEKEKASFIKKYGKPTVIIPQMRSKMNADLAKKGIADPFNDQPQYDKKGIEKPCMWLMGWK